MNRTTVSLIAGVAALAAVTGFASMSEPDTSGTDTAKAAAQLPVERTSLLCPAPSTSDLAETAYTSFTPVAEGTGDDGAAELTAAGEESADGKTDADKGDKKDDGKDGKEKAVLTPKEPGKPVTGEAPAPSRPRSSVPPRAGSRPAGPSSRRRRSRRAAVAACSAPTAPLRTPSSGSRAPAPPRSARTTRT